MEPFLGTEELPSCGHASLPIPRQPRQLWEDHPQSLKSCSLQLEDFEAGSQETTWSRCVSTQVKGSHDRGTQQGARKNSGRFPTRVIITQRPGKKHISGGITIKYTYLSEGSNLSFISCPIKYFIASTKKEVFIFACRRSSKNDLSRLILII